MVVVKDRKKVKYFSEIKEVKTVHNEYYFSFFILIPVAASLTSVCSVTISRYFFYYLCLFAIPLFVSEWNAP